MAYTIEEEQELNQLKEWWKDNGKAIIAAFILGIGGMLGWRYWQSYQANQIMQASAEYDALVYTANKDAAAQQAKFVKAHDKTSYAVFSLLDEAKGFVAKQDYASAENSLKQAIAQSQDDILTSLAALRLSAVQFQQGQFDAALASLNQVKSQGFSARSGRYSSRKRRREWC